MNSIHISQIDHRKLSELISDRVRPHTKLPEHIQALKGEVDRAIVVEPEAMGADVITLNSRARLRDLASDEILEYTLVYPEDSDIEANRISILAPLGTAMLGYRKGDTFEWQVPAGVNRWMVEEVLSDPEESPASA